MTVSDAVVRAAGLRRSIGRIAARFYRRFTRVDLTVRCRGAKVIVSGVCTSRGAAGEVRALTETMRGVEERIEGPWGGREGKFLIAAAPVVPLRDEPRHGGSMVTQAVMGETLEEIVRVKGEGWALVRGWDGYLGYVALRETTPLRGEPSRRTEPAVRVTTPIAALREAPRRDASVVTRLPFDSLLTLVRRTDSDFELELPSGERAWLDGADGEIEKERPRHYDPVDLIARAREMLGAPYLWGGTSPFGFDCSGLVQRLFLHHKVLLPRDADLQARAVGDLSRNRTTLPGDLLFFGEDRVDHVAISLGGDDFLHASGWVRIESLDDRSPLFRADLKSRFTGSGRVRNFGASSHGSDLFEGGGG